MSMQSVVGFHGMKWVQQCLSARSNSGSHFKYALNMRPQTLEETSLEQMSFGSSVAEAYINIPIIQHPPETAILLEEGIR